MNSKNNKTSDLHRLVLNLSEKIDFKRSEKYFILSDLRIYYKRVIQKRQLGHGMINLNCLMDHIPDQMFKTLFNDVQEDIIKKYETLTDKPSIKVSVNKIENRIKFKSQDIILNF